jgi:hypothetical protein
MKPLFNEFDYCTGSHRKLFDDGGESGMDFIGQHNDTFLVPNFFSQPFIEDQNYF